MNEYKRLTERNSVGLVETLCKHCMFNGDCTGYRTHCDRAVRKRLYELEDRIENGTLVELPCKVGDTLYLVSDKIKEFIVTAVSIDITKYHDWGMGCIQFADKNGHRKFDYNIYFSWIGKTVFFDKAEAEQKLKELRGEV